MKSGPVIITFVKNPILGTVKTRLAKTIGEPAALEVYKHLLNTTKFALMGKELIPVVKRTVIYYSQHIEENDMWSAPSFAKEVQIEGDLGDKLAAAFENEFNKGAESVIIIGSDCPKITSKILMQACYAIKKTDLVIGPAKDGGYYMFGMAKFRPQFFTKMPWSTNKLFEKTLDKANEIGLSVTKLETLSDVDYEEDLLQAPDLQQFMTKK